MILEAAHRSPDICLTAEENPRKPQPGDCLMKGLCDQSSLQMRSVGSQSTSTGILLRLIQDVPWNNRILEFLNCYGHFLKSYSEFTFDPLVQYWFFYLYGIIWHFIQERVVCFNFKERNTTWSSIWARVSALCVGVLVTINFRTNVD